MQEWIRHSRTQVERDLHTVPDRQFFSPGFLSQYRTVVPLLQEHARGQTLDLGAGDAPFRDYLPNTVTTYHTLELRPRSEDVTYVGDIQQMPMVGDSSYDTAICLETLEHVPNPAQAVAEIYRVLRAGGKLVLSVPHLSRVHDAPFDYYRFTAYGVRQLLESQGFEILMIEPKGGLFSFLGHQISTVIVSVAWTHPVLRRATWFANKWLVTLPCYHLDRAWSGSETFALGYVAVARKPARAMDRETA